MSVITLIPIVDVFVETIKPKPWLAPILRGENTETYQSVVAGRYATVDAGTLLGTKAGIG